MLAKHFTSRIDNRPRLVRFRSQTGAQKAPIITVRNKTDLLALRLFCDPQGQTLGLPSHLGFAQPPQRQQRLTQLLLGQIKQKVRLVLGAIHTTLDIVATIGSWRTEA